MADKPIKLSDPIIDTDKGKTIYHWTDFAVDITVYNQWLRNDGFWATSVGIKSNGFDRYISAKFIMENWADRERLAQSLDQRSPLDDKHNVWLSILESLTESQLAKLRKGEDAVEVMPVETLEAIKYAIEPLLFKDKWTIIYGEASTLKSYLSLLVCLMVQLPLSDNNLNFTIPERIIPLYLDWEADQETFERRLTLLTNGLGIPATPILYKRCTQALPVEVEGIRDLILEKNVGLVIIDSIGGAMGGMNLSESQTASSFHNAVRNFGKEVTTLAITHIAKSDKQSKKATPFGSIYFENLTRCMFEVVKDQFAGENMVDIALINRKRSEDVIMQPLGFRIQFDKDDQNNATAVRFEIIDAEGILSAAGKGDVKYQVQKWLADDENSRGGNYKEIAKGLDLKPDSVRVILYRLLKNNEVSKVTEKNGDITWYLPKEVEQ